MDEQDERHALLMRIRQATTDDLALVSERRRRFVAEVRGDPDIVDDPAFTAATEAFVRDQHGTGAMITWLAEVDGLVSGLTSLLLRSTPPQPGDPRSLAGYAINVWVEPACRGRGLARALMDRCLAEAATLGVKEVELIATDAGRPLYESLGFAEEPTALRLRLPHAPA